MIITEVVNPMSILISLEYLIWKVNIRKINVFSNNEKLTQPAVSFKCMSTSLPAICKRRSIQTSRMKQKQKQDNKFSKQILLRKWWCWANGCFFLGLIYHFFTHSRYHWMVVRVWRQMGWKCFSRRQKYILIQIHK